MPSMVSRRQFLQTLGVAAVPASGVLSRPARAASAPELTWSRTYPADDEADRTLTRTIVPVDDGFILAGVTAGRGWVGGIDGAGRKQWHRTLGTETSYFLDGVPAGDDGAVLAGVTNDSDDPAVGSYTDPWLVRVTADGDVAWDRTYQADAPGGGASAIVRRDEGYAIAGAIEAEGHDSPWVATLDGNGTVQWRWRGSRDGRKGRAGGLVTVGDGLVVGGSDEPVEADEPAGRSEDAWVARLDSSGSVEWDQRFEGERGDRVEALAPTQDGEGVVAVGRRDFATDDEGDGWLVAIGGDGDRRWQRTYPRETWNWLRDVVSVDDGYVLVGTWERPNSETRGAWLLQVGPDGRKQWESRYTDDAYVRGFTAVPTADGGLFVGGDRSEDGQGTAWLAKVGGDPADSGQSGTLSVPSVPDWSGPVAGGAVLGALAGGAAMRLHNRE